MNKHDKLEKIVGLVQREYKGMEKAAEEDGEYTSLKGNGVNSSEAILAFEPIYKKIMSIIAND